MSESAWEFAEAARKARESKMTTELVPGSSYRFQGGQSKLQFIAVNDRDAYVFWSCTHKVLVSFTKDAQFELWTDEPPKPKLVTWYRPRFYRREGTCMSWHGDACWQRSKGSYNGYEIFEWEERLLPE